MVVGFVINIFKLFEYVYSIVEVFNVECDVVVLFVIDIDLELEEDELVVELFVLDVVLEVVFVVLVVLLVGLCFDDLVFDVVDVMLVLIVFLVKMCIDQIEEFDFIEFIIDGVLLWCNQLLVDLGFELNFGVIDGVVELDLVGLCLQVIKLVCIYKFYGLVFFDVINDQFCIVFGLLGKWFGVIVEWVKKIWEFGEGWVKYVIVEVVLGICEGSSVCGGVMGYLYEGVLVDVVFVDKVIDVVVVLVVVCQGVLVVLLLVGSGGGVIIDVVVFSEFID